MNELKVGGTYQHYKGHVYKVINVAKHSETLEDLVVYFNVEEPEKLWARPKSMFAENVVVNGNTVPRFKLIS